MNTASQTEEKKTRKYNLVNGAQQAGILDEAKKGVSQRALEKKYNVPRTTLQHWMTRTKEVKGRSEYDRFF